MGRVTPAVYLRVPELFGISKIEASSKLSDASTDATKCEYIKGELA